MHILKRIMGLERSNAVATCGPEEKNFSQCVEVLLSGSVELPAIPSLATHRRTSASPRACYTYWAGIEYQGKSLQQPHTRDKLFVPTQNVTTSVEIADSVIREHKAHGVVDVCRTCAKKALARVASLLPSKQYPVKRST
jgi:hypothetical protein